MNHPAVTAPIIGPDNVEQREAYLAAIEVAMTPTLREEISRLAPISEYGIDRAVD